MGDNNDDEQHHKHHPMVGTHTVPSLTSAHSMYYLEDYWQGFVIGMSTPFPPTTYANTTASITASGDATCKAQAANVLIWANNFDVLFYGYLEVPLSEWQWNSEYAQVFLRLCAMANAMIAIDAACYFSTIIWMISNNFILNWNTLYARLVHYFWTIL